MKELNIWFICIGEPLPQNNNFENLHRCGTFAYNFSKKGHKVKWVTSDFDHFSKDEIKIPHVQSGSTLLSTIDFQIVVKESNETEKEWKNR